MNDAEATEEAMQMGTAPAPNSLDVTFTFVASSVPDVICSRQKEMDDCDVVMATPLRMS